MVEWKGENGGARAVENPQYRNDLLEYKNYLSTGDDNMSKWTKLAVMVGIASSLDLKINLIVVELLMEFGQWLLSICCLDCEKRMRRRGKAPNLLEITTCLQCLAALQRSIRGIRNSVVVRRQVGYWKTNLVNFGARCCGWRFKIVRERKHLS